LARVDMVSILELVEVGSEEPRPSVVVLVKFVCDRAQRVISLHLLELIRSEICRSVRTDAQLLGVQAREFPRDCSEVGGR